MNADKDEDIQTIAERAVIPNETSHNEPFEVTAAAVACALKAADQQGRAYASLTRNLQAKKGITAISAALKELSIRIEILPIAWQ